MTRHRLPIAPLTFVAGLLLLLALLLESAPGWRITLIVAAVALAAVALIRATRRSRPRPHRVVYVRSISRTGNRHARH